MMQDSNLKATNMVAKIQEIEEQAKETFWGYLGCKLVELNEQEAIVSMEVKPHHLNMMGLVNGGVTASLVDNTMGMVAVAARPEYSMVTSDLNLNYVTPFTEGTLFVKAHIVHADNRSLTCYATVSDEQGRIGTIGTGTFRAKRK